MGAGVAGAAFCGATAGIGCAIIAGATLGAASGAASNVIDQHGNGKKFSWKSFAKDTIVGGVVGGVSGGVAGKIAKPLDKLIQKTANNLNQKILLRAAIANKGRVLPIKIKDPAFRIFWQKREYVNKGADGVQTTVHWMQQRFTGRVRQIKIKHVSFKNVSW